MSKLQELINEYCPDGVEYKRLGEIAVYSNNRISISEINSSNYVGVENLLQNKAGKIDSTSLPKEGSIIKFYQGDILIGNIRPYLKKNWLADIDGGTNGDVLPVHITDKNVNSTFLFYCLSSDSFFYYDMQHAKGAKMPRGNKQAIMDYQIPIPPLAVQSEIVRILDHFTVLTAELTARKKQYEYYRDKLLTFKAKA